MRCIPCCIVGPSPSTRPDIVCIYIYIYIAPPIRISRYKPYHQNCKNRKTVSTTCAICKSTFPYFCTHYFIASLCWRLGNAGTAFFKLRLSYSLRFDQHYFATRSVTVPPSKTNKSLSLGIILIVSDWSIHLRVPYTRIKRSYKTMLFAIARNVNTVRTKHGELPLNIHTRNIQTEHTANTPTESSCSGSVQFTPRKLNEYASDVCLLYIPRS